MKYDAVIFDKDGVLIDSMKDDFFWADKLRSELLREEGIDVDPEEIKEIVVAQHPSDLNEFMRKYNLTWDKIQHLEEAVAKKKIERLKRGEIDLYPEVEKVLEKISQPKALVSNAPLRTTEFVVEYYGLEDYFRKILSPSTDNMQKYIRKKKPNPEMVRKAIEALDAENPLMVGDTSDDMEVAENAGIDCCLVNPHKPYMNHDPKYRFDSLKGILEIPGLS